MCSGWASRVPTFIRDPTFVTSFTVCQLHVMTFECLVALDLLRSATVLLSGQYGRFTVHSW